MKFTASLFLILILTSAVSHSQTVISGKVQNDAGQKPGGSTEIKTLSGIQTVFLGN